MADVPARLRDQAQLITGIFDEVATRLGRLYTAQATRELVRELYKDSVKSFEQAGRSATELRYAHLPCYFHGKRGHIGGDCEKKRGQ